MRSSLIVNKHWRSFATMSWYCISAPHSEDVFPVSRMLLARGHISREMIRRCLPKWEEESILAVIAEVERLTARKIASAPLFTGIVPIRNISVQGAQVQCAMRSSPPPSMLGKRGLSGLYESQKAKGADGRPPSASRWRPKGGPRPVTIDALNQSGFLGSGGILMPGDTHSPQQTAVSMQLLHSHPCAS